MNRSPHFPYPSFLHTPPLLHLESTSPCLLSFTTHRNPIAIQSSVSVKYFVGIRWQKKQALWLLWASLCLLAACRVQLRLSRGNIQLLVTLTHLFSRVFWCLSVILYTQNVNDKSMYETNSQGTIYQVVVIHLLLLKFHWIRNSKTRQHYSFLLLCDG